MKTTFKHRHLPRHQNVQPNQLSLYLWSHIARAAHNLRLSNVTITLHQPHYQFLPHDLPNLLLHGFQMSIHASPSLFRIGISLACSVQSTAVHHPLATSADICTSAFDEWYPHARDGPRLSLTRSAA